MGQLAETNDCDQQHRQALAGFKHGMIKRMKISPFMFSREEKIKGKILILSQEIYPQVCIGGLGKFVAGISHGMQDLGWETTVFLPENQNPVYLPYYLPEAKARSRTLVKKALSWCCNHLWWPNWLWVQDWEGAYQAEVWRQQARGVSQSETKIIWTIHSPLTTAGAGYNYGYQDFNQPDEPIDWGDDFFDFAALIEKGISNVDLISTVSFSFARKLTRCELFSQADQICGINNGIDSREWDPYHDKQISFCLKDSWPEFKLVNKRVLQRIFGLPQRNEPVFAFVSRLVPQKGIDLLIEVLPGILAKNRIQLIVVGQGLTRYQSFFARLKSDFPQKLGLCLQSEFRLPHQVFAGADFLILPSFSEPFGIVVAEARQYGVIPIVSDVDGLADQVRNDIDGLTFETGNVNLLAGKIYEALRLFGSSSYWTLSSNGRNRVEDWLEIAARYEFYLAGADQQRYPS
ncbi:MAG TPA: glycosyltransferase [Candidatus Bathyarchaeia archaeon]|nr:glycosyltransferase [Candidatus Bathyarchaeia archaeon]